MNEFVLITATDKARASQALNLVGSLQHTSPDFAEIWVYDLGLTRLQKLQFRGIPKVTLKTVAPFSSHWRQCWSWKPWIWTHSGRYKVIFLDAGTEVLRDLTEICNIVNTNGYFLVSQYETLSQGHTLKDIVPNDYYDLVGVPKKVSSQPVVAAGIMGFSTTSDFYNEVIKPTYQYVKKGYNLGWSADEMWRNTGLHKLAQPPLRDCSHFRHDQTLFNLFLYKSIAKPVIQPVKKFGGFNGPNEHPEQLIWNSRLHNPLAYIGRIQYRHFSLIRNFCNKLYLGWCKSRLSVFLQRASNKLRRVVGA